jgi:hypothetical protein
LEKLLSDRFISLALDGVWHCFVQTNCQTQMREACNVNNKLDASFARFYSFIKFKIVSSKNILTAIFTIFNGDQLLTHKKSSSPHQPDLQPFSREFLIFLYEKPRFLIILGPTANLIKIFF